MKQENYLLKRIKSFGFAFKGIKTAFKKGYNLHIQIFAAVIATLLGFVLNITITEWVVIILCIGLVLSAEIFNSAIEQLTDLVSPERNEKAGKVKDLAAGAVLVSAIASAIIGLIIFLPKILKYL